MILVYPAAKVYKNSDCLMLTEFANSLHLVFRGFG